MENGINVVVWSQNVGRGIAHCNLILVMKWTMSSSYNEYLLVCFCLNSVLDCMEVFSKGIHRALVPIDGHGGSTAGVELSESASGYRMVTQMDVLRFLKSSDDEDLTKVMSHNIKEVGGVVEIIFGASEKARVIDAIKNMRTAALAAVPILESSNDVAEDHKQLINARGRKLKGTFSATDLRGCPIGQLQSWLSLGVLEFIEKLSATAFHETSGLRNSYREAVTCHEESPLGEVVEKAVSNHVHRIWVVDQQQAGLLVGVVSLTDMIRVIRGCLVSDSSM
ncbi:kinase modulator [Lithospermum erythrorhizon]|uniref:Kinase modulator n=1 Tax=Lithospermum erythrorhizon TaxID=34254 RepID=A0AAV3QLI4_LITER